MATYSSSRGDALIPSLKEWAVLLAREQPALVATLGYLVLTLLGMGYQFALFRQFGINILDYAEIGDFLLAAVRDPLVIALALLPLPLIWLLNTLGNWMRRRFPLYAALHDRTDTPGSRAVVYPLFVAVYFLLFSLMRAERVAEEIKRGEGKEIAVELIYSSTDAPIEAVFLGQMKAFIFIYHPAEERTLIIPIENISRIIPDSDRLRRAEADRSS